MVDSTHVFKMVIERYTEGLRKNGEGSRAEDVSELKDREELADYVVEKFGAIPAFRFIYLLMAEIIEEQLAIDKR